MARWSVRKRDGVWVVLDQSGRLRYAAAEYRMALSFALMKSERRPYPAAWLSLFHQSGLSWSDPIQKWLEAKDDEEGDE